MKFQTRKLFAGILVLILAATFTSFTPLTGSGLVFAQQVAGTASGSGLAKPLSGAPVHPFEPSEELLYVAEFSRALLKKIDVADFRFTAAREPLLREVVDTEFSHAGGSAYSLKFTGEVSSKGFFSKLFNLRFRERIESIVEPTTFTVKKTKRIDEQGKRARISESTYDNGKVVWLERDPNNPSRPPRSSSAEFSGHVQDVLSAIYFLRTQPLQLGKTFEITISDSGVVYQVPVHVVEKTRQKTVLGRIDTLRVDADIFGANRMIAGNGQFSIWFTNDNRHIPVSARIKTEHGTFDITLRKVIQNPTPRESMASTKW
jgi:Protein of unknown function (DUF3108)